MSDEVKVEEEVKVEGSAETTEVEAIVEPEVAAE